MTFTYEQYQQGLEDEDERGPDDDEHDLDGREGGTVIDYHACPSDPAVCERAKILQFLAREWAERQRMLNGGAADDEQFLIDEIATIKELMTAISQGRHHDTC